MTRGTPPLAGLRVAVTRPADDAAELADLLTDAGAHAVLAPLTRILPPADDAPLRAVLDDPARYDWIVFTSPRAVRALAAAFGRLDPAARIAAVGPATAAAVRSISGRAPDVVPDGGTGAALVPAMLEHGALRGRRVLWPRAEQARPELPRDLAAAGAVVDDPLAYRTVADPAQARRLVQMVRERQVDVITFTAPSAVNAFVESMDEPVHCAIAVIGPATAAAARAHGLPVHVEPERPIIPALVAALAHFRERGPRP